MAWSNQSDGVHGRAHHSPQFSGLGSAGEMSRLNLFSKLASSPVLASPRSDSLSATSSPIYSQRKFEWEDDVVDATELSLLLFLARGNWIVYRSSKNKPCLRWLTLSSDLKFIEWREHAGRKNPQHSRALSSRFRHMFRPKYAMPIEQVRF